MNTANVLSAWACSKRRTCFRCGWHKSSFSSQAIALQHTYCPPAQEQDRRQALHIPFSLRCLFRALCLMIVEVCRGRMILAEKELLDLLLWFFVVLSPSLPSSDSMQSEDRSIGRTHLSPEEPTSSRREGGRTSVAWLTTDVEMELTAMWHGTQLPN